MVTVHDIYLREIDQEFYRNWLVALSVPSLGIILGMGLAKEGRHHYVMPFLIGRANDLYKHPPESMLSVSLEWRNLCVEL